MVSMRVSARTFILVNGASVSSRYLKSWIPLAEDAGYYRYSQAAPSITIEPVSCSGTSTFRTAIFWKLSRVVSRISSQDTLHTHAGIPEDWLLDSTLNVSDDKR